jgi:Ca2+-binding EF-hand superfamily protein
MKGIGRMTNTSYVSIAAVLLVSGLAFAHPGANGPFAHWDRDGSGSVTKAEMRTAASERFDKTDQNSDGRITPDEVTASRHARGDKRFAEKDKNKDGQLSRDEVPRMPEKVFTNLDKNKDGKLSREEMSQLHGQGAAGGRLFQHADANHDGVVTRDESLAAADALFTKLDANADGLVTKEEAKKGFEAHARHTQGEKPGRDKH